MCKVRSFRQRKLQARRDIHREMCVAAYYYETANSEPLPVSVRIWTKWDALGVKADSSSDGYGERAEMVPKILFMRAEVMNPRTNALVSVAAGEAYQVLMTEAPDLMTITAQVSVLPENSPLLTALKYPS